MKGKVKGKGKGRAGGRRGGGGGDERPAGEDEGPGARENAVPAGADRAPLPPTPIAPGGTGATARATVARRAVMAADPVRHCLRH